MSATISFDQTPPFRRPGIVAGIAISVVLHLALLFGYRLSAPPAQPPTARTLTVWLQAPTPPRTVVKVEPPPKPESRPEPKREPKPRKREPAALAGRASPPAPASTTATAPPAPDTPAQAQTITLPAPDPLRADQQQPNKFDINQALKTARKVANEKDPARAGTAVAQLDDHPLYPENHETQLARGVAGAKRGDCKNSQAGLLSPLIWLLDKKDHGCKW